VVPLPVALTDHVRGILVVFACKPMWQNMRAYQNITKNPCLQINAEILLVSRMDYTMSIPLCPLVLVVNVDDTVSMKTCFTCKEH
jgi:hypothetical protein